MAEDVVWEFNMSMKYRARHMDRHMIDIEPHYLMGTDYLLPRLFVGEETTEKRFI